MASSWTLFLLRLAAVLAVLGQFAVTACQAGLPRESNIEESERAIRLSTDDGLRLTLNRSDGKGLGLSIGDTSFTLDAPLVRFEEVFEDPQAADLLQGASWGVSEEAVEESANGHAGRWLHVSGQGDVRPRTTVRVDQTEAQPLVVSGWCQARVKGEAFGWFNRHMALNANAVYTDGARMPEVSAYYGQYDHEPQFNKRVICADRPIQSVALDLSVPGGECTAWYRDVELCPARYRISSPASRLERIGGAVHQHFAIESASLRGLVTYLPKPDWIEVRCTFESTQPIERAISACLAVPFDALGGLWHDDVRRSRAIESGTIYREGVWYGAGRDGYNSRYPIACIETADGQGLGIGTSVAEPRVFQTEYDSVRREFRIRFDLGLTPDAGRWANRGSFTAYLFTYRDGFRGAAEKYHRMFGWAFKNRVERQGIWLPFVSPLAVAGGHEDFRFRFLESVGHMGWDETQGMYSFQYVEPWIHHHEFPPHVPVEEVRGPVVPRAAIEVAKRMTERDDRSLPLDMRQRYPAYLGSYIEDQWGNPQGYFFRHPEGGRNENMMIVNPNDRLPPPPGSAFSSGGWDRNIVRETMEIMRQWHLPGWTFARVSAHSFLEVDTQHKAAGDQSIRLDPVEGKSYFEQYLRGVSQIIRYEGDGLEPLTFSFSARGENVPEGGTGFRWRVGFWYEDGTRSSSTFAVSDVGAEWQTWSHTIRPEQCRKFVSVALDTPTWTPDPTVLWVDEVRLTVGEGPSSENLLRNGGFEEVELLPCRLDGVYLDTLECYACNLNYRRAHWPYAEAPLTFDCARRPAMHQVFSHAAFARRMAEWMHSTDRFVFGNCTPVTPFAAPYLDVMGGEQFWKPGGRWSPWPDAEFNFARFMSRGKPYCLLQYSDLDVEEQTRYIERCLFYGVFPSNQAAPSGGWYWADPLAVERHRPVFAKYVPFIIEVAEAGWQPVTLARTDDAEVWIERFGEGETLYFTVFNSSSTRKTVTVTLDERCGVTPKTRLVDVLRGTPAAWHSTESPFSFRVQLDPEDVAVYRLEGAELRSAL